jgi:hypothetical protein
VFFRRNPFGISTYIKTLGVGGIACRAVVQSLPAATSAEALAEAEALAKPGSPLTAHDEGIADKRQSES